MCGGGADDEPRSTRATRSPQVTFLVLAAGVMAFALLQSLVIPVLPTIQAALHTTQATSRGC